MLSLQTNLRYSHKISTSSNQSLDWKLGGAMTIDTRSLFDKGGFFDFGHPLLNRIAESFVKAAGIGAVQSVSREAYFTAVESVGGGNTACGTGASKRHHRLPGLKGENNRKSFEALVMSTGKESLQWGLAAGMYSGFTYGLRETTGGHDLKNGALAGAITGAAVALTMDNHSHEQVVQCAITGAAISAATNLLTGLF